MATSNRARARRCVQRACRVPRSPPYRGCRARDTRHASFLRRCATSAVCQPRGADLNRRRRPAAPRAVGWRSRSPFPAEQHSPRPPMSPACPAIPQDGTRYGSGWLRAHTAAFGLASARRPVRAGWDHIGPIRLVPGKELVCNARERM